MNTSPESVRPSIGLAIASLVLGILAAVLGLLLIGGLLGIVGILVATLHLRKPDVPKNMAWSGLVLSIIGVFIAVGITPMYIKTFKQFKIAMEEVQKNAVKVEDWVGVRAPDFTVTTLEGQRITLSELKGKRVVLDFWATWCGPCVKEIPHFIEMRSQVSPDELVMVGISEEPEAILKPFVAKKRMNYPVASGKDLPVPFTGLPAIPTTFFIDRNGVIQDAVVGYHNLAALRQHALGEDYAGEPKSPPGASPPGVPEPPRGE